MHFSTHCIDCIVRAAKPLSTTSAATAADVLKCYFGGQTEHFAQTNMHRLKRSAKSRPQNVQMSVMHGTRRGSRSASQQ